MRICITNYIHTHRSIVQYIFSHRERIGMSKLYLPSSHSGMESNTYSQEEATGHFCPICKDMIIDHCKECVCMFMGCGHLFHWRCLPKAEMCPVCNLKISDSNHMASMNLRIAKTFLGCTAQQRLWETVGNHPTIAGMALPEYNDILNAIVNYHIVRGSIL